MIPMEATMEQFVGLDVSQDLTHLCIISSDNKTVWQGGCCSTPDDIATTIRSKSQGVVRIGLESGPLSTWHWHALRAMGLPVVCLDARHVKAAMSAQINKCDKNDAYGLAQIVKALKAWGLRLAKRSGMKKAAVAVARKLAMIMHRMWVEGSAFRWSLRSFNQLRRTAALSLAGTERRLSRGGSCNALPRNAIA
jgi:transposase